MEIWGCHDPNTPLCRFSHVFITFPDIKTIAPGSLPAALHQQLDLQCGENGHYLDTDVCGSLLLDAPWPEIEIYIEKQGADGARGVVPLEVKGRLGMFISI